MDGFAEPEGCSHFSRLSVRYPKVDDGKICTYQFLEASRNFITIYDSLGAAFYVVKKDVSGNIDKLSKVCNKDKEKYLTLNDLLYYEKDDPSLFAVDALLWLKRALEFTVIFIRSLVDDAKKNENITPLANAAYERVLKQHHNWVVQNIFKVVLKALPARSEFVKAASYGNTEASEQEVITELSLFLTGLEKNIKAIDNVYEEFKLNIS